MLAKRLIKSNDAGGGACTNTVDLYNPFPDGGGVALYQLNGNADDVSGNYNGTASNVTYGAGQFGQAGVFNSSNSSQIEIAATATTPVDVSKSNYSISLWVKTTSTSSERLISKYANDDAVAPFTLANNADGTLSFVERGGSGGTVTEITTTTLTVNNGNWHHVVVTKSPTATTIYIDNSAFVNNNTHTQVDGGTTPWRIGRDNPSSPSYFNGEIDQVRIFNRALRPYEVEALYTEEYCTPTIVPSEHFNTVLYTGNQSTQSITGVGFQPDFIWIKERTSTSSHALFDSVRGVNKVLASDTTDAEDVDNPNLLTSFNSDGFSLGDNNRTNQGSIEMVSWNFKAGGAAVTNTDGTITSQVSANTEAGFSIVSWTSNYSGNVNESVGHGLNQVPDLYIVKKRNNTSQWYVYAQDLIGNNTLKLNTTDAISSSGWISAPTETTFNAWDWSSGSEMITYCFAEVEGFSNFGSYVGTGASGNTIVTGFEPAFAIFKRVSSTSSWFMIDNKRNPSNPRDLFLNADTSDAEYVPSHGVEFLENGFSFISTDLNGTGQTWMYMAFAADPTTIEPTLEDSFNTVTYTGNGGTQNIGGVFEGGGSFNGSSSKIEIGSVISSVSDTTDFSFSQWLNFNALPTSGGIMGIWGSSSANLAAIRVAIIETSGQYELSFLRNFNNSYYYANSYPTLSLNNNSWYNLVLTYVASTKTVKYFLNGSQVSEFNLDQSAVFTIDGNLTLGAYTASHPARTFNGSIDQVRIFNTALTAAQVTELYEETDADSSVCNFPSGAGAVALYELNGNANDTCGTYNGTASNVTWLNNGVGFQPDLVWFKNRDTTNYHQLLDSIRGAGNRLFSNVTNAESFATDTLQSFDPNGFTVGSDNDVNGSGYGIVAWCWKGAELPAINSNGSIPSVVSANPAAGFSIVSYTGNGNAATIGHGLNLEPSVVIVKNREDALGWMVYHSSVITATSTNKDYLELNTGDSIQTKGSATTFEGVDDNTIALGTTTQLNRDGDSYIAYCFHSVPSFSKIGSYIGDGTKTGPIITTGFRPAWVMIKWTDDPNNSSSWTIYSNKINTGDVADTRLVADTSGAEVTSLPTDTNVRIINFSDTGFEIAGNSGLINSLNGTYIYMAFANQF
jgi:hypothetical protein